MKKITLVAALLIAMMTTKAQLVYEWIETTSAGPQFDYSGDLLYDDAGNLYATGFYRDSGFVIGGDTLPFADKMDGFISKFNPDGTIDWTIPYWGVGLFDRPEKLAFDADGNLYVVAVVQEEYRIGNMVHDSVPTSNGLDVMLMKFTPEGSLMWHKTFGGKNAELAYGMAVTNNEILLVGQIYDTAIFDTLQLISSGNNDMFVLSLDLSGNVNWGKRYGNELSDRLYAIVPDPSGGYYISGYSKGGWVFGDSLLPVDSSVFYKPFVGKISSDGTPVWGRIAMDTSVSGAIRDIDVDANGNVYAAVQYNGANGLFRCQKRNSAGDVLWDYNSTNLSSNAGSVSFIVEYKAGKVFFGGGVSADVEFMGQTFTGIPDNHYLMAVLEEDGTLDTLIHDGGNGEIQLYEIAISPAGKVGISLTANGDVSLGGNSIGTPQYDIVFAQLNDFVDLVNSVPSVSAEIMQAKAYPNPAGDILMLPVLSNPDRIEVTIFDVHGRQVLKTAYSTIIDISSLASGVYFIQLQSDAVHTVEKIVVR